MQEVITRGKSRQLNPSARTQDNIVEIAYDDLGRQVTTLYQVRDLIATAAVDTATLAEVTLLAATAGEFHDLVELTCANQSGAAVTLSLRDSTGGTIVRTLVLPATATQTFTFPAPIPQNTISTVWTVQNAGSGDVSGTVVSASATFIKNI